MKAFIVSWSQKICSDIFEIVYSKEHNVLAVTHGSLKKLSLFCLKTRKVRWEASSPGVMQPVTFLGNWLFIPYHGGNVGWLAVNVASGEVTKFRIRQDEHSLVSFGSHGAVFLVNNEDGSPGEHFLSFNPEEGVLKKMDTSGAICSYIRWRGSQIAVALGPDGKKPYVVGRLRRDGLISEEGLIRIMPSGYMAWMHDFGMLMKMAPGESNLQYRGYDGRIVSEFPVPSHGTIKSMLLREIRWVC